MAALSLDPTTLHWAAQVREAAYWEQLFSWSYPIYFGLFACGCALLATALLPRRESGAGAGVFNRLCRQRARTAVAGAALLLLLCAVSLQTGLDRKRGFIADQDRRYQKYIDKLKGEESKAEVLKAQYLYLPEGKSLVYLSLGNTSLAADYLWLTSMQYVTNSFRRGQKFEMLNRFYTSMLELDPQWTDAALNAGKVLSALEQNRFLVEKFYQQAMVKNPGNVRLACAAGQLFIVPPLDRSLQPVFAQRAVGYFGIARDQLLKLPRTPENLRTLRKVEDLIARLGIEGGFNELSAELFHGLATNKENPLPMREIAARDYLNAKSLAIADKLQEFVDRIHQRGGSYPPSLDKIFEVLPGGAALRNDAYGFPMEYDAATGKVSSKGSKTRRAIQVKAVILSLIGVYQEAHHGEPPPDLHELTRFVRQFFGDPATPPSFMVRDAVGADFDCENGPLGKWNYDPRKGCIVLPPHCNAQELNKPAEQLLREE